MAQYVITDCRLVFFGYGDCWANGRREEVSCRRHIEIGSGSEANCCNDATNSWVSSDIAFWNCSIEEILFVHLASQTTATTQRPSLTWSNLCCVYDHTDICVHSSLLTINNSTYIDIIWTQLNIFDWIIWTTIVINGWWMYWMMMMIKILFIKSI